MPCYSDYHVRFYTMKVTNYPVSGQANSFLSHLQALLALLQLEQASWAWSVWFLPIKSSFD